MIKNVELISAITKKGRHKIHFRFSIDTTEKVFYIRKVLLIHGKKETELNVIIGTKDLCEPSLIEI